MYFLNIIEKTEKNNKIGNFNISKSTGDLDSQTPSEKASETEMKKLPESGKVPLRQAPQYGANKYRTSSLSQKDWSPRDMI